MGKPKNPEEGRTRVAILWRKKPEHIIRAAANAYDVATTRTTLMHQIPLDSWLQILKQRNLDSVRLHPRQNLSLNQCAIAYALVQGQYGGLVNGRKSEPNLPIFSSPKPTYEEVLPPLATMEGVREAYDAIDFYS